MKQSKRRRDLGEPQRGDPDLRQSDLPRSEEGRLSFVRDLTPTGRIWMESGEIPLGPSAAALLSGQAEPREDEDGLIHVESYRTLPTSTEWPDVFAEGPIDVKTADLPPEATLSELLEPQLSLPQSRTRGTRSRSRAKK